MSSGLYMLPSPDVIDFEAGAEITNWTKEMLETAASAKAVICDMRDAEVGCYATVSISTAGLNTIVSVSASSLDSVGDTEMDAYAMYFTATFDPQTGKTTLGEVHKSQTTIGGESADPYVVLASGSKDVGFAQMSGSQKTYSTPTQFKMDFGFAFTDLMQAAEKPLLLKTRDADGTKCTMQATACINDGNKMQVFFMFNDRQYYCRSTDGGQTITIGYHEYITSIA